MRYEIDVITGNRVELPDLPAVATPELSSIEIAKEKERLIDGHIITVLAERGYDGPNALAKYQSLTDAQIASLPVDERDDAIRYRSECQAAALWITRVWIKANAVMAAVIMETRPVPNDADLIAELPIMVWPEIID